MQKNTSQTKQNYANTATYGQIQPEANKYIDAYANYNPQLDPTIGFRQAAGQRQLERTLNNPAGGYRTPAMRDALLLQGKRQLAEQAGMESRAGNYDVNQQRGGQLGALAALMSPRIVQTGSTGNSQQNTEAGKNTFGNVLELGLGAASIF